MKALLAPKQRTAKPGSSDDHKSRIGRWIWGSAAFVLLALGILAMSQPQIVRIMTNQGLLEIKTDDPSVAIEVLKGTDVIYVIDEKTDQRIEIEAGIYKIRPASNTNTFELSQDVVTMKRGGKVIVTVTRLAASKGGSAQSSDEDTDKPRNRWLQDLTSQEISQERAAENAKVMALLQNVHREFSAEYKKLETERRQLFSIK